MVTSKKNVQKLSIRLLRDGETPASSLRPGNSLQSWPTIPGSQIVLGSLGGKSPRWTKFLKLSSAEEAVLENSTAAAVIFLESGKRWFAISFGLGHVKIDPDTIEQDFGLLVTLNTVDPESLKSADARTPDENTVTRRSQTSRASDQRIFGIDIERDIVRGVSGRPKDSLFGTNVSGSDALSLHRKLDVSELSQVCSEALAAYNGSDYKAAFGWIDKIKFIRDKAKISDLDGLLVEALRKAIKVSVPDTLQLAFPVVYDPDNLKEILYRGFDNKNHFSDLDIYGYIDALRQKGISDYESDYLSDHTVHEVDDEGHDIGQKWKIKNCIVFEVDVKNEKYILSDSKWYRIDRDLVNEVTKFFRQTSKYNLPDALAGENEVAYNKRISVASSSLLCLDRKNITPSGASTVIEVCDFLSNDRRLIHVKDQSGSSRLSHLFNQGTVSARVLITDAKSRDKFISKIKIEEANYSKSGFSMLIPNSTMPLDTKTFSVVYGVINSSKSPRLPFFSLVSFRQAATELSALGYKYEFAWIARPASKTIQPTP